MILGLFLLESVGVYGLKFFNGVIEGLSQRGGDGQFYGLEHNEFRVSTRRKPPPFLLV